jgi:hypothetical protein
MSAARDSPMKHRLELELDVITNLLPLELALKIASLVQEVIETLTQSFSTELAFDVFVVLDGREVRLIMEPV